MSKLWNWIKYIFSNGVIGTIWQAIFENTKSEVVKIVCDADNQAAALRFVTELALSSKSSEEKKNEFNAKMTEWAKSVGKTLTTSTINCLRENALLAWNASQAK